MRARIQEMESEVIIVTESKRAIEAWGREIEAELEALERESTTNGSSLRRQIEKMELGMQVRLLIQYNTIQYNIIQYNIIQYNTIQ